MTRSLDLQITKVTETVAPYKELTLKLPRSKRKRPISDSIQGIDPQITKVKKEAPDKGLEPLTLRLPMQLKS